MGYSILAIVDINGRPSHLVAGEFDGNHIDTYALLPDEWVLINDWYVCLFEMDWTCKGGLRAIIEDHDGYQYYQYLESVEVPTNLDECDIDLETWMEVMELPVTIITKLIPVGEMVKIPNQD
jgi:hypothetical protein